MFICTVKYNQKKVPLIADVLLTVSAKYMLSGHFAFQVALPTALI